MRYCAPDTQLTPFAEPFASHARLLIERLLVEAKDHSSALRLRGRYMVSDQQFLYLVNKTYPRRPKADAE